MSAPATVSASGTNGVAAAHIDTFNQNNAAGIPIKDRTVCVAGLQKFYFSIDPILYAPLAKNISDADYKVWADKGNAWINETATWVSQNLGPAALSKFQDWSGIMTMNWDRAANPAHNSSINLLTRFKSNLKDMMLSNAWDDMAAKCAH